MTNPGPNNDAADWFAAAFPNKPIYLKVTSDGKARIPTVMPEWPANLGLTQASLTSDHNWFSDSGGQGIMDIAMLGAGKRPISWENAFIPCGSCQARTRKQDWYQMFLAMLQTFPDYFDFTQGLCFDSELLPTCNWAKQYYGRTPKITNEVWIAFQETANPMPSTGGALRYGGWARDWEYGLSLLSTKGTTVWRNEAVGKGIGLLELFNQTVANAYNGQARRLNPNQTMILTPAADWKGITGDGTYKIDVIYVGSVGKVNVEVGNDTIGWEAQEWDRETGTQWYTKTLTFAKKPYKIKITPTSDPLYMHMVKAKIE